MTTDSERFEKMERMNKQSPADSDFLRKAEDAGRRYQNSPGADANMLGTRDLLMEMVDRRLKHLEDSLERRFDDLERRSATAPQQQTRSTGLTWERFKAMDASQQKDSVDNATGYDMATMYFGKSWESIMALETRLAKLEKALNPEGFEESLLEDSE